MPTAGRTGPLDAVTKAEAAHDELADALAQRGVTLPSLRLDAASCAPPAPRPLLDLGRCNVDTAWQLAAALRSGLDTSGGGDPRVLTIKVYRVLADGSRTPVLVRATVRAPVGTRDSLPVTVGFPPCRCPRCRG